MLLVLLWGSVIVGKSRLHLQIPSTTNLNSHATFGSSSTRAFQYSHWGSRGTMKMEGCQSVKVPASWTDLPPYFQINSWITVSIESVLFSGIFIFLTGLWINSSGLLLRLVIVMVFKWICIMSSCDDDFQQFCHYLYESLVILDSGLLNSSTIFILIITTIITIITISTIITTSNVYQ